jgi:hypothetical protein
MYISRDVIFHESRFPYAVTPTASSLSPSAPDTMLPPILFPASSLSSTQPPASPSSAPLCSFSSNPYISDSAVPQQPTSSSYEDTPPAQIHPMRTRSMNNIIQRRQLTDSTVRYPAPRGLLAHSTSALQEPTCFSNAVTHNGDKLCKLNSMLFFTIRHGLCSLAVFSDYCWV